MFKKIKKSNTKLGNSLSKPTLLYKKTKNVITIDPANKKINTQVNSKGLYNQIFKSYLISSRTGESFYLKDVDFSSILNKIQISTNEKVPNGFFNFNLFPTVRDLLVFVKTYMPTKMIFDTDGRFEITMEFDSNFLEEEIGWQGLINSSILSKRYADLDVGMKMYDSKGICGIVDGITGNWYPESFLDIITGKVIVILDTGETCEKYSKIDDDGYLYDFNGEIIGKAKNPKYRFEPLFNFVFVPESLYKDITKTRRVTIIIKKDPVSQKPFVSKLYPGYKVSQKPYRLLDESKPIDLLHNQSINKFWNEHVIIETIPDLFGNFPNLKYTTDIYKLDNLDNIVEWIKKEVESFVKYNIDKLDGYNVEDFFQEICVLLAKKRGVSIENIPEIKIESTENEDQNLIDIRFMDKTILKYKYQENNGLYTLVWNDKAVYKSFSKYMQKLIK